VNLEEYCVVFVLVCSVSVLIALAPLLSLVVPFSGGAESFSEFWVLGPNRVAEDYPFNVSAGEEYLVYVGVENHLGFPGYYVVYVKFRNQFEKLPNITAGVPSVVLPLFEYRVFVEDGESWEAPLVFSFSRVSFSGNQCLVETFTVNDVVFNVDKPVVWDAENSGYYYQVFLELWVYNAQSGELEFHDRFVSLWLNMVGG
jgi:hypothetical protein